ncbi:DUF1488 family protein [Caldimonas tepidiphila]|uniref:DUF1488 family protein n=1 Tax=Caldimonas tepidiphila TaxID=2315841 RepID=UPI000E5A2205|nr:DUF1488 family protein [Caldimonas tepidiphila]
MTGAARFSNPVLVQEGVAFCVSIEGRRKVVAIATTALLRPAEGQSALDAFRRSAAEIQEVACRLILDGASSPVFIEPNDLRARMYRAQLERQTAPA